MTVIEFVFWFSIFVLIYTYVGYGILIFALLKIKNIFSKSTKRKKNNIREISEYPNVTLFVPAYNEIDNIESKIKNSFELDYPHEKLEILVIDDGSEDGTGEILSSYENIKVHRKSSRGGKIAAINWGMQFVESGIVVFSDANTLLSKNSIKELVKYFNYEKTGCVSGEKRIIKKSDTGISVAGEGMYWKYESLLKKMDSEFNSAVGADGALFAVRKELLDEVEDDTILDDFVISLKIAIKGYKIKYTSSAYAMESASKNIEEELKRKVRIAAGCYQALFRLKELLNPFKHSVLTFQYISHKVLRWTLSPISMFMIVPLNIILAFPSQSTNYSFYLLVLYFQIIFYILIFIGYILEKRNIYIRFMQIPYYFAFMNYAMFPGIVRYFSGKQNVKWERAKRADSKSGR